MTRRLRINAPAKINWTLEVLRIRPDGYHELRTILQTIDLCDTVTLSESDRIEIILSGDTGHLADQPPEENLAYRAAEALRRHAEMESGVRIEIEKRIPVAAGLGGGSSDAAAVIRGCNVLWSAGLDIPQMRRVAADVGSDPPFFIVGGTALARGRGEHVEPLPDALAPPILLATPPQDHRGEKTARMFDALAPNDFSEGYVTIGLADAVESSHQIDDAMLNNVFERVTAKMQPETENAMDALRALNYSPHVAGAGPSFFVLLPDETQRRALELRIKDLGFEPRMVHALPRTDALRIEES
jgi:4-diphosphocytidyl-2-C-methyl-D-erythritol kinase